MVISELEFKVMFDVLVSTSEYKITNGGCGNKWWNLIWIVRFFKIRIVVVIGCKKNGCFGIMFSINKMAEQLTDISVVKCLIQTDKERH